MYRYQKKSRPGCIRAAAKVKRRATRGSAPLLQLTDHRERRLQLRSVVQRDAVEVSGGEFDTYVYEASNGFSKGAEIALFFQATDEIGDDGDTISLVQTVTDTTKLTHAQTGADITPQPTTSQLGNRKLTGAESYADEKDTGTGIDQEVLDKTGKVVNVDPRYSEKRMSASEALNVKGKSAHPYSVKSAKKQNGKWSKAQLNDAPALNTRINRVQHKLSGGMQFEVAAVHNESGKYLGSVRWGWHMSGDQVKLDPVKIEMVDSGGASATFHRAAKKWNETKITGEGGPYTPMQLPVDATKLGGA